MMKALTKYGYLPHPSITGFSEGNVLAAYALINIGVATQCSNIGDGYIRFSAKEPLFKVTTTNCLFILAMINIASVAVQL